MSSGSPKAFLATPFGEAFEGVRRVISRVLEDRDVGLVALDGELKPGSNWSESVLQMLRHSDVVIGDVSGSNVNVFFELGLAIGMGKPLLLLSRSATQDLPTDIRGQSVAIYDPEDLESLGKYIDYWLRETVPTRATAFS